MIVETIYTLWKHRIGKAPSVRIAIERYNKAGIGVQAFLKATCLPGLVTEQRHCADVVLSTFRAFISLSPI